MPTPESYGAALGFVLHRSSEAVCRTSPETLSYFIHSVAAMHGFSELPIPGASKRILSFGLSRLMPRLSQDGDAPLVCKSRRIVASRLDIFLGSRTSCIGLNGGASLGSGLLPSWTINLPQNLKNALLSSDYEDLGTPVRDTPQSNFVYSGTAFLQVSHAENFSRCEWQLIS
jgi:hypothetical protein